MYFYLSGIKLTWGSLYCDLLFVCTYLYVSGIALYLGFFVLSLQILSRILNKDLRRALRKVLLYYVRLLLYQSLCTKY